MAFLQPFPLQNHTPRMYEESEYSMQSQKEQIGRSATLVNEGSIFSQLAGFLGKVTVNWNCRCRSGDLSLGSAGFRLGGIVENCDFG
jgi:hypothetical protein